MGKGFTRFSSDESLVFESEAAAASVNGRPLVVWLMKVLIWTVTVTFMW